MGEKFLETVVETENWGAELAVTLIAGDLVIISGPLGAGKTALSRGIGAGLGVEGRISSPTFVIARAHAPRELGKPGMIHVDAYRLLGAGEQIGASALENLDALDLDTDLADNVVVIEWGTGLAERLSARYLAISLERQDYSETRIVRWEWVGEP